MRDIWKTLPDSRTIAIEQMCGFRGGGGGGGVYALKNGKSIKFKMAALPPLLTLICVISGKPCQMARPLL